MVRKKIIKTKFKKVINEVYPVKEKRGGGIIKIDAWEDSDGNIVKYSMAYINHSIYPDDNGRVLGYDNTHNYHHKHYFGNIMQIDDFIGYNDMLKRFEKEIKEFIK